MDSKISSETIRAPDAAGPALVCYALNRFAPRLVPAGHDRQWMDDFPDRHAYRCLPLSIANCYGWHVLCPVPIELEWNGGPAITDLTVRALKPLPDGRPIETFCRSNFSRGIVTMHVDYIFRTPPGWQLLASGPANLPKDNAYPLTGIIESDWLPYPFTMNWQVLRPGRVVFEQDEPYCSVFPIQKDILQPVEPEIRLLAENAEINRQHDSFRAARDEFMKQFHAGDADAIKQAWQKHYFVGRHPDGTRVDDHQNKLRLKEPVDRRQPADQLIKGVTVPYQITIEQGPGTKRRIDPRWHRNSLLNRIDSGQTAQTIAGRKRIDRKGNLLDWSGTKIIRSHTEASGSDFLVTKLLSSEQCQMLSKVFWELESRVFKSDTIDPYWNNRVLWFADIAKANPAAGRLMLETQRRAVRRMTEFFRLKAPIYADLLQIVRWNAGMFMQPHADNANPDGAAHGMAYRDLSGILYLNDDYEGGELYFTSQNIAIKPQAGMFVGITAGFHHEHAVLRVKDRTRLTMPSFFTFDSQKADPNLA